MFLAASLLAGCDMLGIESPEKVAATRDADGRAVGAACRQAARAIEDCYVLNKKADRAAIFAGWRDMNDYMRDNKMEAVAPQLSGQVANAGAKTDEAGDAAAATDDKRAAKGTDSAKPSPRKSRDS
jgi:hypothetical protein